MHKEKLLSIIIPTYNAEQYLDKCLSSMIFEEEELFRRLEVIVVNDGSPDGSRDIAQKYVNRFPDVFRLINKENGGHGSGINVGSKAATGLFFKVLDADDWVDTKGFVEFIKKLSDIVMEKDEDIPEAVVTFFKRYDISKKKYENKIAKPDAYNINYCLGEVMDQWQNVHEDMHFWGIAYNTLFYRNLGYQLSEGVFYEDQEYATVPLSYARKVRFIDEYVYIYRVGDINQSVFGETQVKRRKHLEKVLERLLSQYKEQNEMPLGADRYYRKKTAMVVTSYYQIMLLKNKDKKMGRDAVKRLNNLLMERAPIIYEMTCRKCKLFVYFSYLHISNDMYELVIPKIARAKRRLIGQKV